MELITVGLAGGVVGGGIVGLFVRVFLPGYIAEKAKNLATKEDIAQITHQEEGARAVYAEKMELLRSDIARASHEHQTQFSKLHERRAEAIAELYRLLVAATWRVIARRSYRTDRRRPESHSTTAADA